VASDRAKAQTGNRVHLAHLDGLRGLAAWFVVFHHAFLDVYGGVTADAPWFLGFLRWGHFAVVIFIALSGYSLALGPRNRGNRLPNGFGGFMERRGFRILPPYWAAIAISAASVVLFPVPGRGVDLKSIIVYGLLLQNFIGSQIFNNAMWSIAIEWQIYFGFPAMLYWLRRFSVWALGGFALAVAIGVHLVADHVPHLEWLGRIGPEFWMCFVFGVIASNLGTRPTPRWLPSVALAAVVGFVAFVAIASPDFVERNFFSVDIVLGAVTGLGLMALATPSGATVSRWLSLRTLAWLGTFSYSVYLIAPAIQGPIDWHLFGPDGSLDGIPRLLMLSIITFGLTLPGAYLFHRVVERPFLTRRSFDELRRKQPVTVAS
jgi:peptidoglycan/LPS O-acetylase OafA/YrhL